jgi:penicillin-insensitive murein endopeptidase
VAGAQTEPAPEEIEAALEEDPVLATGGSESASVGLATNGRLSWGVRFDDSPVAFVKVGSETSRHGTAELVAMVASAAEVVAAAFPGTRLMVGDLSHRRGGRLHPHDSHRAGRDVDLGFFLTDPDGNHVVPRGFVGLNARGRGRDRHGEQYRFDVERNWALVETILRDESVHVQFILINAHLKRLLRAHARRAGVDRDLLARFEEIAANRSGSSSHRSHFHVRIYCAADDRPRCVDAPPFHAWAFDAELAEKRLDEWRIAVTSSPRSSPRGRRVARHARRARMRGMRTMMRSSMTEVASASTMEPATLVARTSTMRTARHRARSRTAAD